MADMLETRNNAPTLNPNTVNGQHVDIAITVRGSDLYFAICAIMGVVALGTIGASMLKPRTDRIFFYITAGINMVACIAYFTMGSNLGWTPIDVEFLRSAGIVSGRNREIFYVRYVDWFITTPLLLTDLLLTAGMPWPTVLWTILLDWVMIVTGLVGALVKSRYKWGYYAFGCAAMFYIFWNLGWEGRKRAKVLGNDVSRVYILCGVWTLFIWLLYPVAWGLCEGGNVIAPDSEAIFYGILDLCAKPVFSIMLIVGHWNIDPARMGMSIQEPDHNLAYDMDGNTNGEKHHSQGTGGGRVTGTNGVSDGIFHEPRTTNGASYATTGGRATGANIASDGTLRGRAEDGSATAHDVTTGHTV